MSGQEPPPTKGETNMENAKKVQIQWAKMHTKDYAGNCTYCGGRCTDTTSAHNWELATDAFGAARATGDKKQERYLTKKINEHLNFVKK